MLHWYSPLLSLHSTMFLLIPSNTVCAWAIKEPLHSTMFLLIRRNSQVYCQGNSNFTFHNVSINTPCSTSTYNTRLILPLSVDPVIYNFFETKFAFPIASKSSIFLINKGFVDLPGFFPYRRSTITEWNWLHHLSVPRIPYPTIFPALI